LCDANPGEGCYVIVLVPKVRIAVINNNNNNNNNNSNTKNWCSSDHQTMNGGFCTYWTSVLATRNKASLSHYFAINTFLEIRTTLKSTKLNRLQAIQVITHFLNFALYAEAIKIFRFRSPGT
jgi:hypothetical protein